MHVLEYLSDPKCEKKSKDSFNRGGCGRKSTIYSIGMIPGEAARLDSQRIAQMPKSLLQKFPTVVLGIIILISAGCAQISHEQDSKVEIGFIEINSDMKLRRMVVHHATPKGVVLFLHGFPETLYAWKDISLILARDYEVHAFDWPGYGLSSRPSVERFSYAPQDYARVLKEYIGKSRIDTSKLVIYATDIGALPALIAALDQPDVAKKMIVGDFAPFDRPQYMYASLQSLKSKPSSDQTRAYMNSTRDEILENAFRRGLSEDEQFAISQEFRDDMFRGWSQNNMTSADAFYYYYSHFTRDQDYFESNLNKLTTPVTVIWGEKDFYIKKEMGVEFANKANLKLISLTGIGHYPHLQSPKRTIAEIRASFDK
jgi:pimeloyl-ACP methyl ester carboxylesterase